MKNHPATAPSPERVSIELTTACNYRCRHCATSFQNHKNITISREAAFRLVEDLGRLDPYPRFLNLFGQGEVTILPWLPELLEYATAKLPKTEILLQTNGSRLTELAEVISRTNVSCVIISVDGATERVYEIIRGKGTYKSLIAGLDAIFALKEKKRRKWPHIGFTVTLTKDSIFEMEAIVQLGKRYKVNHIHTQALYPHKELDLASFSLRTLTQAEKERALQCVNMAEAEAKKHGIEFKHQSLDPFNEPNPDFQENYSEHTKDETRLSAIDQQPPRYRECTEPWKNAWVNADLRFNTCELRRDDATQNLREMPFHEYWYHSPGLNKVRESLITGNLDPICSACILRKRTDTPPNPWKGCHSYLRPTEKLRRLFKLRLS